MNLRVQIRFIILLNSARILCKPCFILMGPTREKPFWKIPKMRSNPTVESIPIHPTLTTTHDLIVKNGYKAETHFVTTEDDYILGLHRIVNSGKQPVLLQHGLLDSSATFVLMGPDKSLGYYLSNNDYDVWLGNSRGNRYSRNHTTLNPKQSEFWNFSWHEIGIYDIPATIDYILNITGFGQIYYIAHSQGTTAFFVMCSKRPEYNEKIKLMQAMAPAVYLNHARSPTVGIFRFLMNSSKSLSPHEIFPYGYMKKTPCYSKSIFNSLCLEGFFLIVGHDGEQFNKSLVPVIFSHVPAGSSINQFRHYYQNLITGQFSEYNFGKTENLRKYGQIQPPKYNLSAVTAPIILHYGANDFIVDHIDVERLYKNLNNVKGLYRAALDKFNHIDFVWSKNVKNLINKKVLSIMKEFANGILEYIIE